MGVDQDKLPSCFGMYLRFAVALMAILCTACCYISRQNLSLAIIAMTKQGGPSEESANNGTSTTPTPLTLSTDDNTQTYGPKYDWKGSQVLGAFFWTYVICQIPGGRLAEVVGPKWILLTAGLGSAILSGLSPLAASIESTGEWSFFCVRLLMGVCQAAMFPSCYIILTNWLPLRERQIGFTLMNAGAYFGSIIAMESTGYFTSSEFFGWTWAFYFPAIVCSIWSLIWLAIGTSKPEEHSCISKSELQHIEANKGDAKSSTKTLDWSKLLRSRQVWGVVVAFFSSNWSFALVLQMLPSYLRQIQGFGTKENAHINEYLYIIYAVSAPIVGSGSTYMIKNRTFGLNRIVVRKLSETIAVWGQAICFLALIQLERRREMVKIVLFLQMFSYSFVNGGEVHLPTEISADFGGTIYAIANCIASCTGFIVPLVLDWVVKKKTDLSQWNNFLYLAAAISFLGNLLFIFIGGDTPEDLSKSDSDDIPPGSYKMTDSLKTTKPTLTNGNTTHLELNEMDKLRTSTKNYSTISMPISNGHPDIDQNNGPGTKGKRSSHRSIGR